MIHREHEVELGLCFFALFRFGIAPFCCRFAFLISPLCCRGNCISVFIIVKSGVDCKHPLEIYPERMKTMKLQKLFSLLLSAALMLGLLAGCGAPASAPEAPGTSSDVPSAASSAPAPEAFSAPQSASSPAPAPAETPAARTAFRIASLKGPTTLGLMGLMDDAENGRARHDYQVAVHGTADEIAPQLLQGQIDIALVPCNLASVLYNKTEGAIEVAAINTLGVLYIVATSDEIKSVADLAGATIYTTGKGTTPEFALNYVLRQNGLTPGEDVTVEFMSEATEVLAAMQLSDGWPVAMLPQPYVTTAQMQMENLRVALDLTEEWDRVSPDSALVTGVVVVRREFAEQNPDALREFLEDYKASTEFVNANTDTAAALAVHYGIVPKEEVARRALPACNITFLDGAPMKEKIGGYLQVLFEQDPQSVGGVLPDDAFYYGA